MACTFRHNPTMIDSIIHCLIKADNSTKNKCAAKDIISCNPQNKDIIYTKEINRQEQLIS